MLTRTTRSAHRIFARKSFVIANLSIEPKESTSERLPALRELDARFTDHRQVSSHAVLQSRYFTAHVRVAGVEAFRRVRQ